MIGLKRLVVLCLFSSCVWAGPAMTSFVNHQQVTIDLQNVNVQDALHILAKMTHCNMMISPLVQGVVSLHLHDMSARQAFDLIVQSRGLVLSEDHGVLFVMPQAEWMRQAEEEEKRQVLLAATVPLVTRVWQMHYAKADDIAHLIQDGQGSLLSKRGYVRVDVRTNCVCVQDIQERILAVSQLIQKLDVPVQQVLIETRLASVDSDFEHELGLSFSAQPTVNSGYSMNNSVQSAGNMAGYGLSVLTLANGSLLDVKLAALEQTGHGELISSPSLFTANQQPALIESGEEIPYQEISRSGATGVAFKKAVLSLRVTPQVLPDKKVLLQLQINQDKPSNRIVLGVPAITTRQISTNVLVKNGQTIVLGGIFESNQDNIKQRVPYLSDTPVVGWLFQQKEVIESKRELLIFVTPKIVDVQ